MEINQKLQKIWITIVSKTIWISEYIFFYPKLAKAYGRLQNFLSVSPSDEITIFDVGANRGQSIKFFKRIYPDSSLWAFEPQSDTFLRLNKEIIKKKYKQIQSINVGLSSQKGVQDFYPSILAETSSFSPPNLDSSYYKLKNRILLNSSNNSVIRVKSQVTTLDSICNEFKIEKIDIVKIDVEGHELQVLLGAEKILSRGLISVIQVERHFDDMRASNATEISELLISHNFTKYASIKHPFGSFFEDIYVLRK